ncbi:MAG: hypothetical protein ABSB69_17645 [Solirubrobacteraceae bacterium]|jgi:hypothetical protein
MDGESRLRKALMLFMLAPGWLLVLFGVDFLANRETHHPVAGAVLLGIWFCIFVAASTLDRRRRKTFS